MEEKEPDKNKIKGFKVETFERKHLIKTDAFLKAIDRIFDRAIGDYARLAGRMEVKEKEGEVFSFNKYPAAKAEADKIIKLMAAQMKGIIDRAVTEEWEAANFKNDAFLNHVLKTSQVDKKRMEKYQARNMEALAAFQVRKINKMNLSQRVWDYAKRFQTSMELSIDVNLGEGKPAPILAREIKKHLKEPDKLFRRVRDKHGNLQLSKAAKLYNPGRGVYRSAYKNAMRVARTEINMAYRRADDLRWKQLDFVVGYEVKLSNNHTNNGVPFRDICDDLKGKYPKGFQFVGWHPHCRCYKVPILKAEEEYDKDELGDLKAALNGTAYKSMASRNQIKDLPENFKSWMKQNSEKVDGYRKPPYFIKDNFKYGKIRNGLKKDVLIDV